MPVKEEATKQVVLNALDPQAITTDTTTAGPIIDTKDYDGGLYFALLCYAYTDGTYTMKIEHGDDSGLSDAADVDSAMLVYGSLPALTADIAEGAALAKEAVHSTKRYVRMSVVSTSTTSGASLAAVAVANPEVCKTDQQ